ncbi:Uncharacterised protein [Mycobacteroides abscessus subsp. abscessus]|nr:Uncharacterised protein [Mycobacteroides abscessus subsp. abscessus]
MHVERLAIAQQFTAQRRRHLLVVVRAHIGEHRITLLGRGQDGRHLADTGQAHLQGARNRGRAHGEHVHMGAQRLDVLLVLHAEPLFLVDDHQAEVLPPHTGLQ